MNAFKVFVACVCLAVLVIVVAVPYRVNETAGRVCLAAAVLGGLAARSAGFASAMGRWGESLLGATVLLVTLATAMPHILPGEAAGYARIAAMVVAWALLTAWLGYKIVQTLLGPPATA